jgi:hypothetical protein
VSHDVSENIRDVPVSVWVTHDVPESINESHDMFETLGACLVISEMSLKYSTAFGT